MTMKVATSESSSLPTNWNWTWRDWVGFSIWLGLLAGFWEWSVLGIQNAIDHKITVDLIRTNRHSSWMILISNLLIISIGLGILGLAHRWLLGRWRFLSFSLIGALATLGGLLSIKGMHWLACAILSLGVGVRATAWLREHPSKLRSWVWRTLPIFSVLSLVLGLQTWNQVVYRESKALKSLTRSDVSGNRPSNVLLIVMDNVRADRLSLYGYERDTTPNLVKWSKRGVRFDQARSPAPWTLPSHASMFTGRWPHQLSANAVHPLDESFPTLAGFLSDHGYASAGFVGNTYYCNSLYGLDRGFARYEDFYENEQINLREIVRSSTVGRRVERWFGVREETPGHPQSRKTAAMINEDALNWIDTVHQQHPFFVFLNYYDAHEPFIPPGDWPRSFDESAKDPARRDATLRAFARLGQHPHIRNQTLKNDTTESQRIWQESAKILSDSQDDCMTYLDHQIGLLLEQLDKRGLLDQTLVVITSDHGEHFGEHSLFGHGNSLYRQLIDIPLLIIPPKSLHPQSAPTVDEPVSTRSLPVTIVDLLGISQNSPFPGTSLAEAWKNPESETTISPPFSHVEHQTKFPPSPHNPASLGPIWSILYQDRVYIRNGDGREELYHYKQDPGENSNLSQSQDHQELLKEMRSQLDQVLTGSPEK